MTDFTPPTKLTRDDLIEVLRRNMAGHWIEGLLEDPSSLSQFEGTIAVLLRIQDAIDENLYNGSFILTAEGRRKAESTVRLFRNTGPMGAVVIPVGFRFLDERGAVWRASAEFTIPAAAPPQEVDVPVETDRSGYFLNTFLPLIYQAIDTLPDPNLSIILGTDPALEGVSPFLDQHGKERRVFRAPGENDDQYRNRMVFLVDQVSPKALAELIPEVLDAFPATKSTAELIVRDGLRTLREPFRDTAQPSQLNLTGFPGPLFFDSSYEIPFLVDTLDGGAAYLDDPGGDLLRDVDDACAWFDILLPTPVDPAEGRRFFDDGDAALGAYFDDAFADDVAGEAIVAPIQALVDELDRRRAGCVQFRILFGEDIDTVRSPPLASLSQAGEWVDQDGNSSDLDLTSALMSHDADFSYVSSATGRGAGTAVVAEDLVFDMPAITAPLSIVRVVLRARARRNDLAVGTDPILAFIIQPSSAGAPERLITFGGDPVTFPVSDTFYREYFIELQENPLTAAPWVLADFAGTFGFGLANVEAAAAPTDELRVSELLLEIVADYG